MAERVFNLPDLGEGLEDAEIVEWKVSEGDTVELNQPLIEVNTAKALVEIPSPVAGVITTLHGAAGDVVEVGKPLVTFEVESGAPPSAEGEAAAAAGQEATGGDGQSKREAVLVGYGVDEGSQTAKRRPKLKPPGPRRASAATSAPTQTAQADGGKEVRAAPPVRRLARERGIDLATVSGSGPEGRITREDVLNAAEGGGGATSAPGPGGREARGATPTPAEGEERVPVRGVRRMIAEKMARSWREIPHVTTFHTVDASAIESLRKELTASSGVKVSALSIVVRALADVCGRHPKLSSSWDDEAHEIVLKHAVHVGIATDTERGLMVPVVRDAAQKSITHIASEIAELVEAARAGKATLEQLTGGTVTVTNVGTYGSAYGTPIINIPEAAILALGRVEQRAVAVDGAIAARPSVTLSLSFDHRVLDGADADKALTDLRELLESSERLRALPQ